MKLAFAVGVWMIFPLLIDHFEADIRFVALRGGLQPKGSFLIVWTEYEFGRFLGAVVGDVELFSRELWWRCFASGNAEIEHDQLLLSIWSAVFTVVDDLLAQIGSLKGSVRFFRERIGSPSGWYTSSCILIRVREVCVSLLSAFLGGMVEGLNHQYHKAETSQSTPSSNDSECDFFKPIFYHMRILSQQNKLIKLSYCEVFWPAI